MAKKQTTTALNKQYTSHAEVPAKEKWNLSALLKGQKPEDIIKTVFADAQQLVTIKDSKYQSAAKYLQALELEETLSARINEIFWWVHNSSSLNVVDPYYASLMQQLQYAYYQFTNALGPELPRILKHADNVAKWAKTPAFSGFRIQIEADLEQKPHTLADAVEEYSTKYARANGDFSGVFQVLTDAERDRGEALTSTGRKIKITSANEAALRKSDDKKVRRTVYDAVNASYYRNRETLSNLLYQHKKAESTIASVRNFDSAIAMLVFPDRVPKTILESLFTAVQGNINTLRKYDKAWKRFYKLRFGEARTKYDTLRDLVSTDVKISIKEGADTVVKALAPFGDEYVKTVKKALAENWVDFHAVKDKISGAYSSGTYNVEKKLVLMNWDFQPRSVETLAHEFGHAMHSHYSHKTQRMANSQYKIFVAEIASIFNELMLNDYWLKNATDDEFRFEALSGVLKGFTGTVFRQVEWANYEYDFYNAVDKGAPLSTFEAISKLYVANARKYAIDPKRKFEATDSLPAIFVPHFYYGFYVYKYAIGQLVANIFFAKYQREGKTALQDFIKNFLSVGGSKSNLDTLKDAGVDLLDPHVWDLGFESFNSAVDEWIKLGNKLFVKKSK